MASEQSGKSTSSNSDDNFSLPSSKLAGDSNSLSSDIVDDHENTTIENKCDNNEIDVGDGCFDDHTSDNVEKDQEYQESLHECVDDLAYYLEEDFLRMIEPDESRFYLKNTS